MTSYIEKKDDGRASSEKELSIGSLSILDLSTDNTNVPSANYPATESDRRFKQGPDRRRVRQAGQFWSHSRDSRRQRPHAVAT
jgi:hypothetical protein